MHDVGEFWSHLSGKEKVAIGIGAVGLVLAFLYIRSRSNQSSGSAAIPIVTLPPQGDMSAGYAPATGIDPSTGEPYGWPGSGGYSVGGGYSSGSFPTGGVPASGGTGSAGGTLPSLPAQTPAFDELQLHFLQGLVNHATLTPQQQQQWSAAHAGDIANGTIAAQQAWSAAHQNDLASVAYQQAWSTEQLYRQQATGAETWSVGFGGSPPVAQPTETWGPAQTMMAGGGGMAAVMNPQPWGLAPYTPPLASQAQYRRGALPLVNR